ncbi:MAG: hypothetical protein KY476_00265 [Planctomycetes bacterium]|nr:hypothetical protein [Planctomycetota bacterium]
MLESIRKELRRVVGQAGVDVAAEDADVVRIETADDVHHLPRQELLRVLNGMCDGAGILALREELDRCQTPARGGPSA